MRSRSKKLVLVRGARWERVAANMPKITALGHVGVLHRAEGALCSAAVYFFGSGLIYWPHWRRRTTLAAPDIGIPAHKNRQHFEANIGFIVAYEEQAVEGWFFPFSASSDDSRCWRSTRFQGIRGRFSHWRSANDFIRNDPPGRNAAERACDSVVHQAPAGMGEGK